MRKLKPRIPPGNDERLIYIGSRGLPWGYYRHIDHRGYIYPDVKLRKIFDQAVEYLKVSSTREVRHWVRKVTGRNICHMTLYQAFIKKYGRDYFTAEAEKQQVARNAAKKQAIIARKVLKLERERELSLRAES